MHVNKLQLGDFCHQFLRQGNGVVAIAAEAIEVAGPGIMAADAIDGAGSSAGRGFEV